MEQIAWVVLGALVGGACGYILGYVRAAHECEVAIRLLQIEWQSTLKALTKDES